MVKQKIRAWILLAMAVLLMVVTLPLANAQDITPVAIPIPRQVNDRTVVLSGEPLFEIQAKIGIFTPQQRAQATSGRIKSLAEDLSIPADALKVKDQKNATSIVANGQDVLVLTEDDAEAAQKSRQTLASEHLIVTQAAVTRYRESRTLKSLLLSGLYACIATMGLLGLFFLLGRGFSRLYGQLHAWRGTRIPALRMQDLELLTASQITDFLIRVARFVKKIGLLLLFYGYVTLVLSLFPWTKQFGNSLSGYIFAALDGSLEAFVAYLPNLFVIALVIIITYYALRFVKFIFVQLGRARDFSWFYPEWVEPTYKLATFLVMAIAIIVAFPYLPGAQSPAFQGVTLFLGLLVSLGSSTAVSNVVAGVILIYTRAFQTGDRVKIGDAIGDIVVKTLLVTRIRTIKNVVITIPNAAVLNAQIINYSALAQDKSSRLILHTTITLGYDVPWRHVHTTLIQAAQATPHILGEPSPFVLQTSLDDFYVSYELNAYTDRPTIMARIYSELHQNIQDCCNQGGIEILSPHYRAVRDGNQNTIPADYLPPDYQAPGFRIDPIDASPSSEAD